MSEAYSMSGDSVRDLAAEFAAKASAKASSKKPTEWILRLDAVNSQNVIGYCESQAVIKPFEAFSDSCKAQVIDACYNEFITKFWSDRTRPANPQVQALKSDGSVDSELIFILQDKFKINIAGPEADSDYNPEWAKTAAIKALQDAGLTPAKAKKFVETELDCIVSTHFLSLQEMIDGVTGSGRKKISATAITKSAGHKLMKFMLTRDASTPETLTDEEFASITYKKLEYIPKAGLLDRVCSHCKSLDDLKCIFKVIQPVISIRSDEFGVSDSEAEKADRLTKSFAKVVTKTAK